MKQQTRFYVSRKNPLTWIAAALSLASIVLQILALCLGEGAVISTVNIWFQKVLPMAVSLGFALQLVLEGETRFYRTSKPIFWACVYFGQAALDLHLHGGYALFGYMRYVVMCWILYLLLYLIYRLTITGKIPVSYPLLFTLLVPLAIPTNGCASVTISAETSGISQGVEALMRALSQVDGVRKVEVLAG